MNLDNLANQMMSECEPTIDSIVRWAAQRRGKQIYLYPWPGSLKKLCGMWLTTHETEHIYLDGGLPPLLWDSTVLHEVSHIVLNHNTLMIDDTIDSLPALLRRLQAQRLNIHQLLGRSEQEDKEAEYLAQRLLQFVLDQTD